MIQRDIGSSSCGQGALASHSPRHREEHIIQDGYTGNVQARLVGAGRSATTGVVALRWATLDPMAALLYAGRVKTIEPPTSTERTTDAGFAKYAKEGAYHWREASNHLRHHQAFTVERYRRTLAAAGDLSGRRVLDYGCGDGALLGWIAHRVGPTGDAHGFDPNPDAQRLSQHLLDERRIRATVHTELRGLADESFDVVISAEVIEHVHDLEGYFADMRRLLRPGGIAVLTTPIRLTEEPQDPNHVVEWFPDEWKRLLDEAPLTLTRYEQFIPAAAPEVYFWRPRWLLRLPVPRLLCNVFSILFRINVLTALDLRPRLFMTQLAVLKKN